jgi:hypothetical protein
LLRRAPCARLVCSITVILAPGRDAAAPQPDAAAMPPLRKRFPLASYSPGSPTDFDVPALVAVAGVLVIAAATKGGYPLWAIGGTVFLYVLSLAIRRTNLSRARLFPARRPRVRR